MRSLPAKHIADYVQTSPLAQSTLLEPCLIPELYWEERQKGKLVTKPRSSARGLCLCF